jgi:glycosyltransferase involved in cell wall biosynthesis
VTSLVFAAPAPPFPLDNGSRIRTHRLLTGLAREFDTTFITYAHHPDSGWAACTQGELTELLPGIDVMAVPGLGARKSVAMAGLKALASPHPASWGPHPRRALARVLLNETRRRGAAILHFDHFAFFSALPGLLNVRAPHNVESVIARQEVAHQRGYGRVWHAAEWRKLRRLEERSWRNCDLCVAVSEPDAHAMTAAGARAVVVCPNGTDPVGAQPPPALQPDEPLRLLFVGTGDYPPYTRGVAWFVQEVLPLVRARAPATLDIVGRLPEQPLAVEGVQYAGTVPEVAPWYERAHVAIVPVFDGSGTRLKLVEAMAHGVPVVSTRLGAEGLPIQAPTHYLQADRADAFADSLIQIASWARAMDGTLATMLEQARAAIEPLFWPRVVRGLADRYRAELESRGSREASRRSL